MAAACYIEATFDGIHADLKQTRPFAVAGKGQGKAGE
jgi:hypothetical protein